MAKTRRNKKARNSPRRNKKARKKVKRGCGKRNWRRGSNAMWRCKVGKRRPYTKVKAKAKAKAKKSKR